MSDRWMRNVRTSQEKPQLTLVNNSDNFRERISLGEAIGALKSDDFGRMNRAGNYTVHYIHGEDIDSSGNAKTWIIAVKNNQSQFYFEYRDQNYKEYPWNEKNISKPIRIDEIILPEDLFSLHRDLTGNDILGDSRNYKKRDPVGKWNLYVDYYKKYTRRIPV